MDLLAAVVGTDGGHRFDADYNAAPAENGDARRVMCTTPRTRRRRRAAEAADPAGRASAAIAVGSAVPADADHAASGPTGRGRPPQRGGGSAKAILRRMERFHGRDIRRLESAFDERRRQGLPESMLQSARNTHKKPLTSPDEAQIDTAAAPDVFELPVEPAQQAALAGAGDAWSSAGHGWHEGGTDTADHTHVAASDAWTPGTWKTGAQYDGEADTRGWCGETWHAADGNVVPRADERGSWPTAETWEARSWTSGWL